MTSITCYGDRRSMFIIYIFCKGRCRKKLRFTKLGENQELFVSAIDLIRVVGNQKCPKYTWKTIYDTYKNELVVFSNHFKFDGQGQRDTPVINAKGVVKLLMWIPGDTAKTFRSKAADILVRYIGGEFFIS